MRDPKILQTYIDTVTSLRGEQKSSEILVKNINEIFEISLDPSDINWYLCIEKDLEIIIDNLNINY